MLIEFRVKNFGPFRDEQIFSMVASNGMALPENLISKGGINLLKAAAIYGPNASGKSTLLRAMSKMVSLVLTSANIDQKENLPSEPFRLDEKSKKMPTLFEVIFFHGNIRYQYGFTFSKHTIEDEWLIAFPNNVGQEWFSRKFNREKGVTKWKFGSHLKGEKKRIRERTRENSLFLSVASQWNNKQIKTVYYWFQYHFKTMVGFGQSQRSTEELLVSNSKNADLKEKFKKFVVMLLNNADLGIIDVTAKKIDIDPTKLGLDFPKEIKDKIIDSLRKNPPIQVEMLHKLPNSENAHIFQKEMESDGTKRLFELAFPFYMIAIDSATVVIDELETSLHSLLAKALIKLIHDPIFNKRGGQLIFTTHDTTLLDNDLFRSDQIWFTEKDEFGASQLNPLSDYRPRREEALQKGYISGRYGAIPILKSFGIYGEKY